MMHVNRVISRDKSWGSMDCTGLARGWLGVTGAGRVPEVWQSPRGLSALSCISNCGETNWG